MGRITQFVSQWGTYTFSSRIADQEYNDNFKDVLARATRLPGADGGFDEYGDSRAPSPVGNVQLGIVLVSPTREGMQALRDDLGKIREWGVGLLYYQPTDLALAERWCYARVNNITIGERRHEHTDLFQPVKLTFQVSDPFWYTAEGRIVYGGGYLYDDGNEYGGGSPVSASGEVTLETLNNTGNAYSQPIFVIRPDTGQSCIDPTIRRVVNGEVLDEVRFMGALVAGDVLYINCQKLAVRLNDQAVYDNRFTTRHAQWMRLMPGENDLQILFALSSDAALVNITFPRRYV